MKKMKIVFFLSAIFVQLVSANVFCLSNLDTTLTSSVQIAVEDTTKKDTVSTLNKKQKLLPLYIERKLIDNKNILNQKTIDRIDYRFTGDILNYFPFAFQQSLGTLGQPSSINIYGFNSSNVSVNRDGVNINNRWYDGINFYDIQSELIDSVELLPPSQSFFYSNNNSPVTFNIINTERNEKQPVSRLRFYQAPNEEGFVSVYLNTFILPRLIFSSEVSNMSINSTNTEFNNDFSNWQIFSRLKYLYSNKINFTAHYYYSKNQTQLNGGAVNNSLIYDALQTTPVYPNRFKRNTINQIDFNIYAKLIGDDQSELSFYVQDELQEFRQDKKQVKDKIPTIIDDNTYKDFGLRIYQPFTFNKTSLEILAGTEKISVNSQIADIAEKYAYSNIAGKIKRDFGFIIPSLFVKSFWEGARNYFGAGTGLNFILSDKLKIFTGYSSFEKPVSWIQKKYLSDDFRQKISAFDLSVDFKSQNISNKLSYFLWNSKNFVYPILKYVSDTMVVNETGNYRAKNIFSQGINYSAEIKFWKIALSLNVNYYFSDNVQKLFSNPKLFGKVGVYYVDNLFENNLNLKAGVNCSFYSEKSYTAIDFERLDMIYFKEDSLGNISPIDSRMIPQKSIFDLFISGVIQKRATVFIVIENLLDSKYYIQPYYLMPGRSLRLGVNWKFIN
jgi:hypothetical protein